MSKPFQLLLQPNKIENAIHAYSGQVYMHPNTYKQYLQANQAKEPIFIKINNVIFTAAQDSQYKDGDVVMHNYMRQLLKVSLVDKIVVEHFTLPTNQEFQLADISFEIEIYGEAQKITLDDSKIQVQIRKYYTKQFFVQNQQSIFDLDDHKIIIKCTKYSYISLGGEASKKLIPFKNGGQLISDTTIDIEAKQGSNVKLLSTQYKAKSLFKADFKFEDMGIGGLNKELGDIFRRAFASRRFPPAVLEQLGIKHIKGLLLFGPPGTGKTLIARQLSKVLHSKEPQIVNGPEIFSKFVGQAEENVRKLFEPAIQDQAQLGDESPLHVIIFDEMDAICKQRGTINSGTASYDNVVNQLLSMIDGVNALSNILIIGMTNRKDLMDEAILRPGRLEFHIEVGLPNEEGRLQILKIHTQKLTNSKTLDSDVNMEELATLMKNYTGAEIEAVVKSAQSFAFGRIEHIYDFNYQGQIKIEQLRVNMADFRQAMKEVRPQFGVDNDTLKQYTKQKIIVYSEQFRKLQDQLNSIVSQTKNRKYSKLNSVLLEGNQGSGTTSLAVDTALKSGFDYVKLISAENFVGFTENGTINMIQKIFVDAYKSPLSCVIVDNIERLIQYVNLGPRFSTAILQALLVLLTRVPTNPDCQLLIIGTTSSMDQLRDLEITHQFNIIVNVPYLFKTQDIVNVLQDCLEFQHKQFTQQELTKISQVSNIGIKKLLLVLDMMGTWDLERFIEAYQVSGQSRNAIIQ